MKKGADDLLVVEMEETWLLLDEKRQKVTPLEDFDTIEEDVWLITDMNGAIPRFQWVESPPKYAEILVQRQLQEAGELEEGARIITHWKKGRTATSSQIYFTAITGKTYLTHENRLNALETHYLLFPSNALLLACLNHFTLMRDKKERAESTGHKRRKKQRASLHDIVAIVFEHGRHVDLLVGQSGQIIGAGRVSSFADTAEAKASLATPVAAELRNIMEAVPNELSEIVYFNWLTPPPDSDMDALQKPAWLATLATQIKAETNILPMHRYDFSEEGVLLTSLPEVLQHLSDRDATATPQERLAYRAQQVMPWTILIMLVVVIGLGTATAWLQQHNAILKAETLALKQTIFSANQPTRVTPLGDTHETVLTFVQNLERWQRAPSFWMLLSELSSARVDKLFFDRVTIQFDQKVTARMTLTGAIESSFQTANKDHEIFLAELTKRNFKVIKSSFATDVTQLTFEIELERTPE